MFRKSLLLATCVALAVTTDACSVDADCVPATCCHPTACVPRQQAPDCTATMCSMNCVAGTLDCGGSCFCNTTLQQCGAHLNDLGSGGAARGLGPKKDDAKKEPAHRPRPHSALRHDKKKEELPAHPKAAVDPVVDAQAQPHAGHPHAGREHDHHARRHEHGEGIGQAQGGHEAAAGEKFRAARWAHHALAEMKRKARGAEAVKEDAHHAIAEGERTADDAKPHKAHHAHPEHDAEKHQNREDKKAAAGDIQLPIDRPQEPRPYHAGHKEGHPHANVRRMPRHDPRPVAEH